jgi:hypothetical protein
LATSHSPRKEQNISLPDSFLVPVILRQTKMKQLEARKSPKSKLEKDFEA